MTPRRAILYAAVAVLILGPGAASHSSIKTVTGQTVYIPVYPSIYHGDRKREFNLAVTLSIRNTDMTADITLVSIDYYDTRGKILKRYLAGKKNLRPLESAQFVVSESDTKGGVGATFVVTWRSAGPVSEPIMESVMIGTGGQQGISFTSRGTVIREQ